jgi:hypothetical protein
MKQGHSFGALVAVVALGAMIAGAVFAADTADRLQLAPDNKAGVGIYAGQGETPEALKAAAALGITAYEDPAKEGGGGAPQKTLIDNDAVKVILVAFKKGFVRPGGVKRRYNTLLVYVDPGRYTIVKRAANTAIANPVPDKLAPGSAVFHRKNSIVSESHIDEDYRVLFVEIKDKSTG